MAPKTAGEMLSNALTEISILLKEFVVTRSGNSMVQVTTEETRRGVQVSSTCSESPKLTMVMEFRLWPGLLVKAQE